MHPQTDPTPTLSNSAFPAPGKEESSILCGYPLTSWASLPTESSWGTPYSSPGQHSWIWRPMSHIFWAAKNLGITGISRGQNR